MTLLVLNLFRSVQVVSKRLVLIFTDNLSVKFYLRSPTDKKILAVLRDLKGDDSGGNETMGDNENNEVCVSIGHHVSSK